MALQRWIDRVVDGAAIAAFAGMFACVLGQVGFRYFLGADGFLIQKAEEEARDRICRTLR